MNDWLYTEQNQNKHGMLTFDDYATKHSISSWKSLQLRLVNTLRSVTCLPPDRRSDWYTLKQSKLSIKRAAKSKRDQFNKQKPKYVATVEFTQHGHILLASIKIYVYTNTFSCRERILLEYRYP